MSTSIIAIDPGVSGGIAWLDADGAPHACAMPDTPGDVLDQLFALKHGVSPVCYMEEVGGYCGVGQPGSAMFKFGRGFGFIEGVLMSLGVRLVLVKPQRWQKHFSLGTVAGSGGKTAWKNKLKAEAQRRFPHLSVTLKTADALLILDYGRHATGYQS